MRRVISFALKGPRFNANGFASQALKAGASYAVIDEKEFSGNDRIIVVEDVLETLQQLAKHHRQTFNIPFLAITGTNGKTTTKELIHEVLASTYKTYTTKGNLNNQIGIPLTILGIKKDAEIAVIEMGANHIKEIESYCRYTLPTHGLITNCGKAHLEGFGGIEGVKKAKGELFVFLRQNNGTAFIMWDYDYLRDMSKGIPNLITYGTTEAEVTGISGQSELFLEVNMTKGVNIGTIQTQLVGGYNLPNVLAAVSAGRCFNVADALIKSSIEGYRPSNSRSQMIEKDYNKIILDAYNANPTSMRLAIENFAHLHADKKVLILGSMAELGKESLKEHELIIELISRYTWYYVVLVGGDFTKIAHPYISFSSSSEAHEWYKQQKFTHSFQLIKGSRSVEMEKILE